MNAGRLFLQASLVLACYLAAAVRTDALHGRHLLQAVARSGSTSSSSGGGVARSSTSATSTGGLAESFAAADSKVLEEAEDTIFKIVAKAIRDAEDNPVLAAVAGGKAIGTAVAKAYAQTVAVVNVEGDGEACASAEADAEASATAYAIIIAKVIVGLTRGDPDKDPELAALAEAEAKAIAVGTADATANAFSSACSTDGFGKAEQESYAEATAQVYAEAVAGGIAIVIGDDAKAFSKSVANAFVDGSDVTATATGSTSTSGDSNADAGGEAGGSAFQVLECKGQFSICCAPFFESRNSCDCGPGCKMNKQSSDVVTWRPSGNSDAREDCFCGASFNFFG